MRTLRGAEAYPVENSTSGADLGKQRGLSELKGDQNTLQHIEK